MFALLFDAFSSSSENRLSTHISSVYFKVVKIYFKASLGWVREWNIMPQTLPVQSPLMLP